MQFPGRLRSHCCERFGEIATTIQRGPTRDLRESLTGGSKREPEVRPWSRPGGRGPVAPDLVFRLAKLSAARTRSRELTENARTWWVKTPIDHPRYVHRKEVFKKEKARLEALEKEFWEFAKSGAELREENPKSIDDAYEDEREARGEAYARGWQIEGLYGGGRGYRLKDRIPTEQVAFAPFNPSPKVLSSRSQLLARLLLLLSRENSESRDGGIRHCSAETEKSAKRDVFPLLIL